MIREDIFAALFALVSASPRLTTSSRTLRHWDDVSPGEMPALFQAQGAQTAMATTGQPTRWLLNATLWMYVSTDGSRSPGEVLNPIVDTIEAALAASFPGQPQTLKGLVEYARIEGTIETFEGTLGNIEVCRIPIVILTT